MNFIKNKVEKKAPVDYKEPYEFRLLIGDNIICQRYFRINNFNQNSLSSTELTETLRRCANMIDSDLKSKTRVYTWYMSPLVFNTEKEMKEWFSNPNNFYRVRICENVVVKDANSSEFMWDGKNLIPCDKKVCDNTFIADLNDKDIITYEFAFYVNGEKHTSVSFEGVYPYYIRRNIDLSNTKGKFEGEDISRLSFESYLLNHLVSGRQDLIKKIVKEICTVCSVQENNYYTKTEKFYDNKTKNSVFYNLDINNQQLLNSKYAKEIAKAKKYLTNECY